MSNKTLVRGLSAAAILAILSGAAYADVDETGVTPKHWYRFDNYKTSSGATEVSWGNSEQGSASNCIASDMGKAYLTVNGSAHPYGSNLQLGGGSYTLVINAKAPETITAGKKAPMFMIGGNSEGIGLFADPTDGSSTTKSVSLLVWGAPAAASATTYVTVATFETEVSTKHHSYAIVGDAGKYALYVDGVQIGETYTGRTWTGSKNFQFGGINGGYGNKLPDSGFDRVSGVSIDDARVYQEKLSADKLSTIAALKYTTNDSGAITEVTAGTYGVAVTGRDLSGLTLPTITALATVAAGATMTIEEAKTGSATFTNVPAGITSISYTAGTKVETLPVTDGTATFSSALGVVDGNATVFDLTFKNNKADIGKAGSGGGYFTYNRPGAGNLKWDSAATFTKGADDEWDDSVGCLLRTHPYIDGAAGAFNSAFNGENGCSIVVVGQMSPTANTQFISIGYTYYSDHSSLLITTTSTKDQVMIATAKGGVVNDATAVYATVPNAASSRHAYVITRQGDVMNVYVDGTKRGQIELPSGFRLGSANYGGIQVGSDFGGAIKTKGIYNAVANVATETGAINAIRVYDYILSDKQTQALFAAYPYVSENGLFTRTIAGDVNLVETEATWTDDKTKESATVPAEGASMTITVDGDSSMTLNAKQATETLTIGGSGTLTIKAGTYEVPVEEGDPETAAGEITASDAAIINTPVVIPYGTLKLAGTPVTLGANGSLTFDCSSIDVSEVMETTTYQLTGLIDQADEKVTVTLPEAAHRNAAKAYKDGAYVVEVTVDTKTLTIPTYEHTSYTVTVNGDAKSVTNNEIAVPYGAEVTVTYQGSTGYHIVGENTKSTTIDKVVEDSAVGSLTFETAINEYTIAVKSDIEHVTASYTIDGGERTAVENGTFTAIHGQAVVIYFTPAKGYAITSEVQGVTSYENGELSIQYSSIGHNIDTPFDPGITVTQTGPTAIDEITEDNVMDVVPATIQTADPGKLAAWITETSGIETIDGLSAINVNCFLMGVENSADDPELKITAEDFATILASESLEDAAAALQEKYPNAVVTVEEVTTTICGDGATNTHLYQLKLSLPTAAE